MHRKGYTVIAYLDNFLLEPCLQGFNTLIELLQNLGFSINWGKVINPFQWLIFLGVEIDTILRQLILPRRKMAEIHEILQFSVSKDKLTKWELQCIIGKLNFASHVIYGGRTFLRQIIYQILGKLIYQGLNLLISRIIVQATKTKVQSVTK